jgi:Antitoxin VbhA
MTRAMILDRNVAGDVRSVALPPSDAARIAIANTVLEGGNVAPETEELLDRWSKGELTDEELLEAGRAKFGQSV